MPTESQARVDAFAGRLATAIGHHRELLLAVHLKTHQAALETMLAEQFVLSTAVFWEVFLSDLLLTYLAGNPKAFVVDLEKRVLQSVAERYGAGAAKYAGIRFPKQISRNLADTLVDPHGYNVTASSSAALAGTANKILAAEFAKKFTLAADDGQFLDFGIAIRNYLSHRSKGSRVQLKKAMSDLKGPNLDLAGTFQKSSSYLKHRNGNGDTRSIIIASRFIDLAKALR